MKVTVRLRTPWFRCLALSVAVGAIFGLAVLIAGFDPPDSDVKYDWLAARAALDGDAYAPVLELAEAEGVRIAVNVAPGTGPSVPHPRTPAALLMMLPLGLVPFGGVAALWIAGSVALLTAMIWVLMYLSEGVSVWAKLVVASALAVGAPTVVSLRFTGQTMLVAWLVVAAWVSTGRSEVLTGGAIAIAGSLKVFPFALVVPLWMSGRRKAAIWAVVGAVTLNSLGLLLPGVTLGGAWATLSEASASFAALPGNASIVGLVTRLGGTLVVAQLASWVIVGGVVLAVWARLGRYPTTPLFWILLALLLLPLSWTSYDVVLIPAVVVLLFSGTGFQRFLAGAALTLWVLDTALWIVTGLVVTGPFGLLARLLLLGAVTQAAPGRDLSTAGDLPVRLLAGLTPLGAIKGRRVDSKASGPGAR